MYLGSFRSLPKKSLFTKSRGIGTICKTFSSLPRYGESWPVSDTSLGDEGRHLLARSGFGFLAAVTMTPPPALPPLCFLGAA